MHPLLSENFKSKIKGQNVFLDNDFLSLVFKDETIFEEIFKILSETTIVIEAHTKFEFLRDIYIPADRVAHENFINQDLFHHIPPHQDVLKQVWGNAQTLSCIYGYKGKAKGVSFVDFMLAGRMMLHKNIFLLSGNKKDFPSCIFDSEGTACFEDQKNMEPRTFWLLSFSKRNLKNVTQT